MKKWARKYEKCVSCQTKDKKHKGSGLCNVCYDKNRDHTSLNRRLSQKKYRANNPEKIKESNRKTHEKNRNKLFNLLGNKCCHCGFSDVRALQIDHINGGGRSERIKYNTKDYHRLVLKSLKNNENKYQLLCANCNWIKRTVKKEWGGGNENT